MIDVVSAVIVRNGRLLLTQRAPEQDAPWLWHCPAGKCEGPESWEDAAIRETREELGLDGDVRVLRNEQGNVQPVTELVFEDRNIAWYAVDIGDHKPLPIEGVGVGWFDTASLLMLRRHCLNSVPTLTEPTERVVPALLAWMRRCASMPAR